MKMRIKAFADLGESVTLLWLRGLRRGEQGDWEVEAHLEGHRSRQRHRLHVPFGLTPLLTLGRAFHSGEPAMVAEIGRIERVEIASLRDCKKVTLSDVPEDVFPDGKRRNSAQPLLLYATPRLDLYIPPLELVRRLFLHDQILAHAILRRGGLAELCAPNEPSFHDELILQFTAAMPLRILTKAFVREFAWLSLHKTGVRSWNSVARLSNTQEGICLDPPEIRNSRLQFRGLIGERAALALEILELSGKQDPVKRLAFTHPALKQRILVASEASNRERKERKARQTTKTQKEYEIGSEASRTSRNPEIVDIPRSGNDFIGASGSIERRHALTEVSGAATTQADDKPSKSADGAETASPPEIQRRLIQASVSDISLLPKLPPLSFRILEPAAEGYLGELEALIATLRRMQELLPASVRISSSLCALPDGKRISWTGKYRRPCLIALIASRGRPPTVLMDIDHAGDVALAALALHFRADLGLEPVERVVAGILGSMDKSGRWPPDVEELGGAACAVSRIKRMLRRDERSEDAEYQARWAAMLIERLGL